LTGSIPRKVFGRLSEGHRRIMWRQAAFGAAVVALLPCISLGGSIDDIDLLKTEMELELELDVDQQASNSHQHKLHRHHKPRRFPFLHRRNLPSLLTVLPAETRELAQVRHPAVGKKLQGMASELHDLRGRRLVAAEARDNLENTVKKAYKDVNNVVAIKSQLAKTQAQIRREQRRMRKLEDDRLRLDRTHVSLVASLHHIMKPKIQFAESRLKAREDQLQHLKTRAAQWKAKQDDLHTASLAMLVKRRKSKEHLAEVSAEEEKIHQEKVVAEKELHAAKVETRKDIEGYKYSQDETKAAMSKEQRGQEETDQEKASLKRLSQILNMEQRRVDESMAIGKDRVLGKIQELQDQEQKSKLKAEHLAEKYQDWQHRQQTWAMRLATSKSVTASAADVYANAQKRVVNVASDKVAMDAESDSDWGWAEWGKEE